MKNNIVSFREEMIKNAVENLKNFGYLDINSENIFTVKVFSMFFEMMLEETKYKYKYHKDIIKVCNELLEEIQRGILKNENK